MLLDMVKKCSDFEKQENDVKIWWPIGLELDFNVLTTCCPDIVAGFNYVSWLDM